MSTRVVVIGGGASGTLTAVHLLRRGGTGLAVSVLEPRAEIGRGVAFGTRDPWHRLNVPAITMSGLPEDPDHFRAFAGCAPEAFPSRNVFGSYLGALLAEARASAGAAFEHVRARAVRVRDGEAGEGAPLIVELADGTALPADAGGRLNGEGTTPLIADSRPPRFSTVGMDSRRPIV